MSELVKLSLATNSQAFRPGETVTALLHASTSMPDHVELQEMEVVFVGIERVDTSWVSPSYRKGAPSINTDKRRVQRHVLRSRLQAATQGSFSDSNLRRFLIRFTLPSWLPPSFRGIAVRYSYLIEAKLQYVIYDSPFDEDDPDAKRSGQAHTATIRSQIMVWPQASDAPAGGTSPRDRETEPPVASNAAAGKGDAFPAVLPDDVPLTCWEVAPGTAVEDAIGHIAKLGSGAMGNASMPFSPRQQQSSSLASDSTSEISHEDHPPAADKAAKQAAAALSRQTSEAERPLASLQADALLTVGGPRTFSLRIGDAPLVKVSIHPPQAGPLQPGSMLAGTLEFPQGDSGPTDASPLRCERVTVLLETEEAVEAAWRPQGKSGSTGLLRRVHDEHIEMTPDTIATHFLFSLPPDATPSFQTPLVALRWVLRFHFVARRGKGKATEQLAWTLPVPVLPPQV